MMDRINLILNNFAGRRSYKYPQPPKVLIDPHRKHLKKEMREILHAFIPVFQGTIFYFYPDQVVADTLCL